MYFALSYNTVPSQYTTVQYNVCLYIYVYLCLYMYFDNTFYYHILIILALPYNLSTLQYSIICHMCSCVCTYTCIYFDNTCTAIQYSTFSVHYSMYNLSYMCSCVCTCTCVYFDNTCTAIEYNTFSVHYSIV